MNGTTHPKWGDSSIHPLISDQIDHHSSFTKIDSKKSKNSGSENNSIVKFSINVQYINSNVMNILHQYSYYLKENIVPSFQYV